MYDSEMSGDAVQWQVNDGIIREAICWKLP